MGDPGAAPAVAPSSRHIVLLGLPGAGKSTIGALVAQRLGRPFVDLDAMIEADAGQPIRRIFAEQGEGAFRAMERARSAALLADRARAVVLAPGGGWIEDAANRARLGPAALSVYLRVEPEVALARMADSAAARPLLAGPNPLEKLRELLARRETFYLQADHTVSSGSMSADAVASLIVALALGR